MTLGIAGSLGGILVLGLIYFAYMMTVDSKAGREFRRGFKMRMKGTVGSPARTPRGSDPHRLSRSPSSDVCRKDETWASTRGRRPGLVPPRRTGGWDDGPRKLSTSRRLAARQICQRVRGFAGRILSSLEDEIMIMRSDDPSLEHSLCR